MSDCMDTYIDRMSMLLMRLYYPIVRYYSQGSPRNVSLKLMSMLSAISYRGQQTYYPLIIILLLFLSGLIINYYKIRFCKKFCYRQIVRGGHPFPPFHPTFSHFTPLTIVHQYQLPSNVLCISTTEKL